MVKWCKFVNDNLNGVEEQLKEHDLQGLQAVTALVCVVVTYCSR